MQKSLGYIYFKVCIYVSVYKLIDASIHAFKRNLTKHCLRLKNQKILAFSSLSGYLSSHCFYKKSCEASVKKETECLVPPP